jgi:hypothetical protein
MHACVSVIAHIREYNCCILINISKYNNVACGDNDPGRLWLHPSSRIHPRNPTLCHGYLQVPRRLVHARSCVLLFSLLQTLDWRGRCGLTHYLIVWCWQSDMVAPRDGLKLVWSHPLAVISKAPCHKSHTRERARETTLTWKMNGDVATSKLQHDRWQQSIWNTTGMVDLVNSTGRICVVCGASSHRVVERY